MNGETPAQPDETPDDQHPEDQQPESQQPDDQQPDADAETSSSPVSDALSGELGSSENNATVGSALDDVDGDDGNPFEPKPFGEGDVKDTGAPPFTLLHIFWWMLGFGLAMSVIPVMPTSPDMDEESLKAIQSLSKAGLLIGAVAVGPMIGMLPFLWIYRRQGVVFPFHPGHWIILHYGFMQLAQVFCNWGQRALYPNGLMVNGDDPFSFIGPTYVITAISTLAGGIVAIFAYQGLKNDTPIWRAAFGTIAVQAILTVIGCVLTIGMMMAFEEQAYAMVGMGITGIGTGCIGWVSIILIIVAVIMDLVQKTRRDWLHWMPFVLLLAAMVVGLVIGIVAFVTVLP